MTLNGLYWCSPGSSRVSCRLIVAHWSCPVPQMCERNMCHLWPVARERSGGALVATSLRMGVCAASASYDLIWKGNDSHESATKPQISGSQAR